jgi:glycosyltransferase involved in cell wall biosynthesis
VSEDHAPPAVAVVVGAFGRTAYLRRAVASVLAQSLPRAQFEVVVTKDFSDPDLDRELAAAGVATILDPEPLIGKWLVRAIRATRAPLVAFLDDDDEFEPDRLARVLEVFAGHPGVGYYRNRVRVIDADGRPVDPARWRRLERDASFDRTGPVEVPAGAKPDAFRQVALTTFASFNSSTVVIRREILAGDAGAAFEACEMPDLALLVAAVVSPYGLYLDDRRLTRFRYHRENATHAIEWLRRATEAQAALAELTDRHGRGDFARWLRSRSEHYDRVFRATTLIADVREGASRGHVARLGADYLRFLGGHPAERTANLEVWGATLYALAYCCWPALGRRVALARVPERRR